MKTKCGQGGRRRGPDENDMKPPTIEERAAKLGMSVVKDETEWLISDDVRGEILRGFPSRRAVSKWLDGAEAMNMRRAFDATDAKQKGELHEKKTPITRTRSAGETTRS